jgi:hypothetical protein
MPNGPVGRKLQRFKCMSSAPRSGPRFGACRFLLLAGYENLAAPLFALERQCKAEVAVAAP